MVTKDWSDPIFCRTTFVMFFDKIFYSNLSNDNYNLMITIMAANIIQIDLLVRYNKRVHKTHLDLQL